MDISSGLFVAWFILIVLALPTEDQLGFKDLFGSRVLVGNSDFPQNIFDETLCR